MHFISLIGTAQRNVKLKLGEIIFVPKQFTQADTAGTLFFKEEAVEVKKVTKEHYKELIEVWESSVRATHLLLPAENILELKPLILQHYFDAVEIRHITKNNEIT